MTSDPCRPSTSVGAAAVSSRSLHDVSVGRLIASSNLRISPGAANVSGEEILASSSHQASTRVADLSSVHAVDESGMMTTSSPVAGNQNPSGGTDVISQKRDYSSE